MAVDIKVDVNTVEITNFLKKLSRKQKSVIDKGLKRVSNMAILMITKRTQSGKLPDGGNMRAYAKGTVRSRKKKGRQTGFVDLTDTGKMFRSLDFRTGGMKSTLFFAGKRRITRPFFSIGNKEEDKLRAEFSKFYFKEMGI